VPPHESLDPGAIVALDAHRGVHAEAARRLPAQHVGGRLIVQEPTAGEGPEHAGLHRAGHLDGNVGREREGFVEASLTTRSLAEHAVDGQDVEVVVGVQGAAEALGKGDGAT
jgi:hypothetical protein